MTDRLYGCNNKPRPTVGATQVGQAGWRHFRDGFGNPCRRPVYVDIPYAMSTTCQYDKADKDAGCAGCEHRKGGV